jgi:hypothetical protein
MRYKHIAIKLYRDFKSTLARFGGFSFSKSHVDHVIDYIKNQEIHHRKKTFTEEYLEFLEKFAVPYDERYIFKPVEYFSEH